MSGADLLQQPGTDDMDVEMDRASKLTDRLFPPLQLSPPLGITPK